MDAVINASPLVFLGKLERLHLLNQLFDTVYVPAAVIGEINKEANAAEQLGIKNLAYEELVITNRIAVQGLLGRLHMGEVEAIVGAMEHNIPSVVLDDNAARNKAKQFGLIVTGTLGVLLRASKMGLIDNLERDIFKLLDVGLYVSDEIIKRILAEGKRP